MNIAICSMFRDSNTWCGRHINQVSRYFQQLNSQTYNKENLQIYSLEGDSKDNTSEKLRECADSSSVATKVYIKNNENQNSSVNSLNSALRIVCLSRLGNFLLEQVDLDWADLILWLESDILIQNDFVEKILGSYQDLERKKEGSTYGIMVAPMVMMGRIFYDTWAFKNVLGVSWTPSIHRRMRKGSYDYVEMQSVGTAALFPSALLKGGVNFGDGAFPELCRRAREELGYHVFVDTNIQINHPNSKCIANRWV